MKQKDIFKFTEGNKYLERNIDVLSDRDYSKNLIERNSFLLEKESLEKKVKELEKDLGFSTKL